MVRTIGTEERRWRLGRRHMLEPAARAARPVDVAQGLVAVHSSDPTSVYLGFRARLADSDPAAIERAMYDGHETVRMMAMRRTLFVVSRDLVSVVQSAASDAVAARERARLLGMLRDAGIPGDQEEWLAEAERAAVTAVESRGEAFAADLSREDGRLGHRLVLARGKRYEAEISVVTRVLLLLGMEGRMIRGRPRGSWVSSQYRWSTPEHWLGGPIARIPLVEAQAQLARRWLGTFGPGTLRDLQWWTGWTVAATKRALTSIGAVEVGLGDGRAFVLPDDVEPESAPGEWVALLPALDSTPMGWTQREWFLGEHRPMLFDTNGNVGPTIWANGRIVGGWAQRADGEIATRLLEDVGRELTGLVEAEAERLRQWIGSARFTPRFRTPLERELVA